ncbi:MAG: FAD-dependent monooxygenase [Candidatus Aenigmarchaeota archaeon]|nr:FAD-dependent monooxygenase [Candidatus Aenigmarchaeota archaeon]
MPEKILPEYDVVIVGAGPAGCAAANFLSPDIKVLLISQGQAMRRSSCGGVAAGAGENEHA